MTISIPAAVELISTNVVNIAESFDNTIFRNYPTGTRFVEGDGIYENTGKDDIIVPAYDALATYTLGQLVFKDSHLNKVTGTSGEFPKQPESYTLVETSYNNADWTTGRYLKFANKSTTQPVKANEKTSSSNGSLGEILFSHDGLYYFELSLGTSEQVGIYRHTLSTAWDISTVTSTIKTTSALITGSTRSAFNMRFNSTGTKIYVGSPFDAIIEERTLSTAYDMTTVSSTGVQFTGADTRFWFNATGSKLYTLGGTTIKQYSLSTSWSIAARTLDGSFDASALGTSPMSGVFNSDGTKFYINGNNLDAAGERGLKYYTLSVPYSFTSGTRTYMGRIDKFADVAYFISMAFNADYSKIFTASSANPSITYEWYLEDGMLNPYHSLIPSIVSETRNGAVYDYKLTESAGVYTFESLVDGVSSSFSPMLVMSELDATSVEEKAYIGSNGTWVGKTLIVRPDGLYIRTTLNSAIEYETLTDYKFGVVDYIKNVSGFSFVEAANPYKPLDNKNYSLATAQTTMVYAVSSPEKFDTLALGRLKADTASVVFKDGSGVVVDTINRTIDRSLDTAGNIDAGHTTEIFYSTVMMEPNSTVEITLTIATGETVELGTILLGVSVDAGYTNLSLQHKYRDFSVAEYDVWGNLDYVERQKINTYSGTVDVPITNYDKTIRLMTMLGKQLVIVNGSTSKTRQPDSQTVFASTQMIGRFMDFSSRTKVKDDMLEAMAEYSFTLEELA